MGLADCRVTVRNISKPEGDSDERRNYLDKLWEQMVP